MEEFKSLVYILERLLGPDGCAWDREQTMQSMRHSLVEETFEVTEAIDLDDNLQMKDEIGDLLFNVIFLCKLAEKEGRFTFEDVLKHSAEKLVRRHPHVFGEKDVLTAEEVVKQWDHIKQNENKEGKRSILDGIPKGLPALAKAQKLAKKFKKMEFVSQANQELFSAEEKTGDFLWKIVQNIANQGLQAEQALRKRLTLVESEFREWEQMQK